MKIDNKNFKELHRLKHNIEIITGMADDDALEYRFNYDGGLEKPWETYNGNFLAADIKPNVEFRIKPKTKYRPVKLEELPSNFWVRKHLTDGWRNVENCYGEFIKVNGLDCLSLEDCVTNRYQWSVNRKEIYLFEVVDINGVLVFQRIK